MSAKIMNALCTSPEQPSRNHPRTSECDTNLNVEPIATAGTLQQYAHARTTAIGYVSVMYAANP